MKYLRRPHQPDFSQQRASEHQRPDEFRIESLLNALERGRFKYYVVGGYSRSRGLRMDPIALVKLHNLTHEDCLFEIKDQRIEDAVHRLNIPRITPRTHNRGPKAFNAAKPELTPRHIPISFTRKQGEW